MNVIEECAGKLEAGIKQFLVSSISGDNQLVNTNVDYREVIYDVYRCAPHILAGVVPYLMGDMLVITYAFFLFCYNKESDNLNHQ